MDTKTALGAAGGISLTVVGAVSALVLTLGGGTSILDGSSEQPSEPVVEYVDEYGNPVDLQQPDVMPEIVIAETPAQDPNVEMMAAAEQDPATYAEGEELEEEARTKDEHEEEDDTIFTAGLRITSLACISHGLEVQGMTKYPSTELPNEFRSTNAESLCSALNPAVFDHSSFALRHSFVLGYLGIRHSG